MVKVTNNRLILITISIGVLFGIGTFLLNLNPLDFDSNPLYISSLKIKSEKLYQAGNGSHQEIDKEENIEVEIPEDTDPGAIPFNRVSNTTDKDCPSFEDCYGNTNPEEFEDPNQKPPQGR